MARNLFGPGAIGGIVARLQQSLTAAGCNTKGSDGIYGQDTSAAVRSYQSKNSLPITGILDDVAWQMLMGSPIPPASQRSLQLTACFEGHGFGLAKGNFDGALLTWGIIGFTMLAGEVQQIIFAVNSAFPQCVTNAFGDKATELLNIMSAGSSEEANWANSLTLNGGFLAEPWRSMFQAFGAMPEVQTEQLKRVQADYLNPAIKVARSLGLSTELGLALCFDIQVQDGGIKTSAMDEISSQSSADISEPRLRTIIANAVADSARPQYQADVRSRKLTVARGSGTVHGHTYVLSNWGLGEFAAPEILTQTATGASQ
jgi:hypothetical protein